MSDELFERLKKACVQIKSSKGQGTGYVVAADRVATCKHVVGDDQDVTVFLDGTESTATVVACDTDADSAILHLASPVTSVRPLTLAGRVSHKAVWDGYGFPRVGKGQGIPLTGEVLDPDGRDTRNAPALILYSNQIAAGMATPLHGFSGSPVVVNDAVVGHLKRFVSDPDDDMRPAFGLVYACPSSAVLKLLGTQPEIPTIQPPAIPSLRDRLPALDPDEYHVFLSYRSTDSNWAKQLVARLEGSGFRVFIDQTELEVGGSLVGQIQSALTKARAGIVLISQDWLNSRWCQVEGDALLNRHINDPAFHLIPIRIDNCVLPAIWSSQKYLDFSNKPGPLGDQVEQLFYALAGVPRPKPKSDEARIVNAESAAADQILMDLKAAEETGNSGKVFNLWKRWRSTNVQSTGPGILTAEILIGMADMQHATEALDATEETVRVRQLKAFALAKGASVDDAIQILEKMKATDGLDAEGSGLLGGSYKKKGLDTSQNLWLQKSLAEYRGAFERTGDWYVGINAATLSLLTGKPTESQRIARLVLDSLRDISSTDKNQWKLATRGEAHLLLGEIDNSKTWYGNAVVQCPGRPRDVASMRKQARMVLDTLGLSRTMLDSILEVPSVMAFSGHMVDAPGRPRFPPEIVGEVRKAIRESLRKHKVGFGFSSAARGSDLIFIQELLQIGGRIHVYLPFPAEGFLETSVGEEWKSDFKDVLRRAEEGDSVELTVLLNTLPPKDQQPGAYIACNKAIHKAAIKQADILDDQPLLLTVWNGNPGDGRGGTADAIRAWQNRAFENENIDISKLFLGSAGIP
jgi:hypothetical protein